MNNGASTITIAASVTHAGAFATTITATAITNSTLPAGTHTLAGIDVAQTWTASQAFGVTTATSLALGGATIGSNALAVTGSSVLGTVTGTSLALGGATIGGNALAVTGSSVLGTLAVSTTSVTSSGTNAFAVGLTEPPIRRSTSMLQLRCK